MNLQHFTDGYRECAAWVGPVDEHGDTVSGDGSAWTPEAMASIEQTCRDFAEACADLLEQALARDGYTAEAAGHDYFLTRNGHGAGFWDRGLGAVGEALSRAAKAEGGADVLVAPDGSWEHLV